MKLRIKEKVKIDNIKVVSSYILFNSYMLDTGHIYLFCLLSMYFISICIKAEGEACVSWPFGGGEYDCCLFTISVIVRYKQ